MKVLERLLAGLAALVLLVLAGLGVRAWGDRALLLDQARHALTAGVAAQVGWRVRVGRIDGPIWNEIKVHDVVVDAGLGPSAPRLGTARRVTVRFHPLHVLRLGPRPIDILVEGAELSARRLEDGKVALVPPRLPPPDPNGLKWPPIRIRVPEARLSWRDAAKVKGGPIGPFARDLVATNVVIEGRGDLWTWQTDLGEGNITAHLEGSHHALSGHGDLDARVDGPIGASWFPYIFPPEKQVFLAGDAAVRLGVHYEVPRPKAFRMAGTVKATGIRMRQQGVRLPLEDGRLDLVLTEKLLDFRSIEGTLAGNAFRAKGQVILGPLRPPLAMEVEAPAIDLASLTPLLPDLADFRLAGTAKATASVRGDILAPETDISVVSKAPRALGAPIDEATAFARMRGDFVDVPDIRIDAFGGIATGSARFGLLPGAALSADLDYSAIASGRLLQPYVTNPPDLSGALEGHVRVRGAAGITRTEVSTVGRGVGIGRQALAALSARMTIDPSGVHVRAAEAVAAGGRITMAGHLDKQRRWQGRFDVAGLPLEAVAEAGLPVGLSGLAEGEGVVDLPLDAPGTWRGQGSLRVRGARVEGWPVPEAEARLVLHGQSLALPDLRARLGSPEGRGEVRGSGIVRLPDNGRPARLHLELLAEALQMGELAAPLRTLAPKAGTITGRVDLPFATLDAEGNRWRVTTRVRVAEVDAPEWGRLEQADGQVIVSPETLWLPEANLTAGGQTVHLSGTVALRPGGRHDLDVPVADLDLQPFLAAFHWDRILEGTILADALGQGGARGRTRPWVNLPERNPGTRADVDSWLEAYGHWLRNHRIPDPPDPRTVLGSHPIWEELRGRLTGRIHLGGDARHPTWSMDLAGTRLSLYDRPLALGPWQAVMANDRIELHGLDLDAGNGVQVRGEGMLGGEGIEFDLAGLDLAWADPWLRSRNLTVTGQAAAKVRLVGTVGAPALLFDARATGGTLDVLKYDEARVSGRYQGGRLNLDDATVIAGDRRTRLYGVIPIDAALADEPMALSLGVEGPSLGIVSTLTKGLVEWQGGDGYLRMRILGSRSAPRLAGVLELSRARLGIRSLTQPLTDVEVRAVIGDGIVKVTRADGLLGGGRVSANGYVTMKQFTLDGLDLAAQVRNSRIALRSGLYDGQVDAALRVGGTLKKPRIAGQLAVSNGTLDLGVDPPEDDDEDPATPVVLDRLVVTLKDTMRVFQPNLMDVRVAGNLIVEGLLDLPDPKGQITVVPVGSKVTTFYTNDFRVTEGTVEFVGSGRTDLADLRGPKPTMKQLLAGTQVRVVATGNVRDSEGLRTAADGTTGQVVKVTATIDGTLASLSNRLTSDPPGYTQQDLERMVGKPQLVSNLFVLAQGNVASASTDLAREFAPGLVNFAFNRIVQPLVDPLTRNLLLSDLSFDIVNGARASTGIDPNQGFLGGFNMALSGETQTIGPVSGSGRYLFRRGSQALGAQNNTDLWRAGLNMQLAQNLALTTQIEQADRLATQAGVGVPAIQTEVRQWLNPDLAANNSTEFIMTLQLRWRGRF